MKVWFSLIGVLLCVAATYGADSPEATYIGHEKVAGALAKGGPLVAAKDLMVSGSHRTAAGGVEVHEKETDVIYVTEGEATFVTGGMMVEGKTTKPGQMLGTSIVGGETRHLTKGDVAVVPAGVPHWFKEVPTSISYFVVKVLKP